MPKIWKSDGEEQLFLEKLLREGKITPSMKPSQVQPKYAMFDEFSDTVFRKHWTQTKKKFRSGCKFL